MKILDGLRGIDFAGIGDDGIPSMFASDPSNPFNVPSIAPAADLTPISPRLTDPANDPHYYASDSKIFSLPNRGDASLEFDSIPVRGEATSDSARAARDLALDKSYFRGRPGAPPAAKSPVAEIIDIADNTFKKVASDIYSTFNSTVPAIAWDRPVQAASAPAYTASVGPSKKWTDTSVSFKSQTSPVSSFESSFEKGVSDFYSAVKSVVSPTPVVVQKSTTQRQLGPSGAVGNKGQIGPSGGGRSSSFTQDFNAVTNGILQVFGVVAANKAAKQQARGASGPRGGSGAQGSAGGASSNMNYYLIGGGILVAGVLLFAATRK